MFVLSFSKWFLRPCFIRVNNWYLSYHLVVTSRHFNKYLILLLLLFLKSSKPSYTGMCRSKLVRVCYARPACSVVHHASVLIYCVRLRDCCWTAGGLSGDWSPNLTYRTQWRQIYRTCHSRDQTKLPGVFIVNPIPRSRSSSVMSW